MSEHPNLATLTAMFERHTRTYPQPWCNWCLQGWPCDAVTLGDAFLGSENTRLHDEAAEHEAMTAALAVAISALAAMDDRLVRALKWAWGYRHALQMKAWESDGWKIKATGASLRLADLRQFHSDYAAHTAASHVVMVEEVEELRKERDAARAALATIAEKARTCHDRANPWRAVEQIRQCARRALEGPK